MSLNMNYQSLGVKPSGVRVTIPDNDLAKLMYYLHCVFVVIEFKESNRYTKYEYYYRLSKEEKQTVLGLVSLFNPETMEKSDLFLVGAEYVPEGAGNKFFEITDQRLGIHMNSEVMIGGVYRKVLNIMSCTQSWLNTYYYEPIRSFNIPKSSQSDKYYVYYSSNNNTNANGCCAKIGSCLDCLYSLTFWFFCCCFCDEGFSPQSKRVIALCNIFYMALFITSICVIIINP